MVDRKQGRLKEKGKIRPTIFRIVPGFAEAESKTRTLKSDQDRKGSLVTTARQKSLFSGKPGEVFIDPTSASSRVVAVHVGIGAHEGLDEERVRVAFANGAKAIEKARRVELDLRPLGKDAARFHRAAVVGFRLATYRADTYKSNRSDSKSADLRVLEKDGARRVEPSADALARAVALARDLGNLPGNVGTPRGFVAFARDGLRGSSVRVRVLDERRIKRLKMGAFLAVASASAEPPRFLILEVGKRSKRTPTIALVGKGVTFDSGGISIKPAPDMEKMRHDKCGGAAVVGTALAVALLKLKVHLIAVVPLTENVLGGGGFRPGDVVHAMDGTSIEILNTDAEGRLLLADALTYVERLEPEVIVDLATLTGAATLTFGKHYAAMLGSSERTMQELTEAGKSTNERVWRLPLDPDYRESIVGRHTDLKNLGGRDAGTITAAHFLQHFVKSTPWVHLDIAGVAYDDPMRPYAKGCGATGFGVRLLTRWLENRAAEASA